MGKRKRIHFSEWLEQAKKLDARLDLIESTIVDLGRFMPDEEEWSKAGAIDYLAGASETGQLTGEEFAQLADDVTTLHIGRGNFLRAWGRKAYEFLADKELNDPEDQAEREALGIQLNIALQECADKIDAIERKK